MKKILTIIFILTTIIVLGWVGYKYLPNVFGVKIKKIETIAIEQSKYDGINVKTIERRENDNRSLLNVAYPVTENNRINKTVESLSQEFIDSFDQKAVSQERLYQSYLAETGTVSNTTITDYTQHFDVSFANDTIYPLYLIDTKALVAPV